MRFEGPMKLKFGITILVICAASFLIYHALHQKPMATVPTYVFDRKQPCPGKTEKFETKDVYVRDFFPLGAPYEAIMNYYACHVPENGDLVIFQPSENIYPIMKIVRAHEGDEYSLSRDKKHDAWNIKINGEILRDISGPYFFGAHADPPLKLYLQSRGGKLKKDEVLLFSSWAPGDRDSGIFGIYTLPSVIGKVIVPEDRGPSPQKHVPKKDGI
jgi:hypothetical protein